MLHCVYVFSHQSKCSCLLSKITSNRCRIKVLPYETCNILIPNYERRRKRCKEKRKDEGKELRGRYKSTRNKKNTRVNYVSSSGPPLQLSSTCPVYFRFPPPCCSSSLRSTIFLKNSKLATHPLSISTSIKLSLLNLLLLLSPLTQLRQNLQVYHQNYDLVDLYCRLV